MPPFLHEHTDFKSLLEITSQEHNISDPYLVEKDYWIMHCLWSLKDLEFNFHLKGGTSLSKGYRCIHRFSEDIDTKIEPDDRCGFQVYSSKNHDRPKHQESRRKYFGWICDQLQGNISGITGIGRDTVFDDKEFRNGGIRLYYESHFTNVSGLKDGILLELGFDQTAPNRPLDISSWALERALQSQESILDNRASGIPCYEPKFTFVEKLQAVIKKFRQYKEGRNANASLPQNFIRHYYDLFQLIDRKDVQQFIGTPEYEDFKRVRFKGDDTRVSNSQALRLSDPKDLEIFKKAYDRSSGLYYQGRPSLEEILLRFSKDINRL